MIMARGAVAIYKKKTSRIITENSITVMKNMGSSLFVA
jgi:hypothetical protein